MSEAKKKHKNEKHSLDGDASQDDAGPPKKMKRKEYEREMRILQGELVTMQEWVKNTGARVCVVFEGVDSAGKGGTIRRITERTSPRVFKHVALPAPSARIKSQMYVQRYIAHFPSAGEVVIFDRSWYNRAGVELVMGYCTPEQTKRFLSFVPEVEKAMVDDGIILIKYFLNVSRRRADPAAREPDRRPTQDLEALSHRPEVVQSSVCIPPRPRRNVRRQQLGLGAVAHRGQRRQEARPAEHHLPPAQSDPVRARSGPRE